MKSEGSARSKRRRARFRGPSFRPRPHKVRQEVQVANNEAVRGQIDKVKHLVSVETAAQRDARLATEAKKLAPKEPLVVNH